MLFNFISPNQNAFVVGRWMGLSDEGQMEWQIEYHFLYFYSFQVSCCLWLIDESLHLYPNILRLCKWRVVGFFLKDARTRRSRGAKIAWLMFDVLKRKTKGI